MRTARGFSVEGRELVNELWWSLVAALVIGFAVGVMIVAACGADLG